MTEYSETVRTERHGEIAVIVVDNPPVNAIARSVRAGIDAAVQALGADDSVHAVVLHCAGGTFMAGADIRKLAAAVHAKPSSQIIGSLEALAKPVIAALQGNALGGGLEFALGCHFRCAQPGTRLGLPEVNLGIIPGAGGTQRLPRLIGVAAAVELIATAKLVSGEEAARLGLVDRLIQSDDILPAAIGHARELLAAGVPLRRASELAVPVVPDLEALLAGIERLVKSSRRGELAPLRAVEAVRGAATLPFEDGIALEAQLFRECRDSSQSRALRHLFFAERQVGKLRDAAASAPIRSIEAIGVVGGGTMGRGIAAAFSNAGRPVTLIEEDATALARALTGISELYGAAVAKGRLSSAEQRERVARIRGSLALGDLAGTDLVVEAVFEDLPLKRRLFSELDRICRPGAILASNTSALDIDALAAATGRPHDVLGLHFFSPAHVMKLVEVVRGRYTGADVLATALKLVRSLGKIGVVAGNCDGFIGNRMLAGYRRESEFLLLEGASPQQVDAALVGFGMAMGPHAMGDMAGLDVAAAGRRRRRAEGRLPPDPRFGVIADRLVEMGRLGQKSGAGLYRYEPKSREPLPDPEVERLIELEAQRLRIVRRPITDKEIVQRCVYPLINEGARILEEGIAQRSGDIDVVWVNGYGFPRARGGPMQFADETGLSEVLDTLRHFEREHGALYWTPAPLLERLVLEGGTFAGLG